MQVSVLKSDVDVEQMCYVACNCITVLHFHTKMP